jgi:glycine/D-amino acid oxidase-like deaminating enzyme
MADMAWDKADAGCKDVDPFEAAQATYGVVSPDGLLGGRLLPAAAHVDVDRLGGVLTGIFRAGGGVIDEHREVTAIRVRRGRVIGVQTQTGDIDCAAVVVAAGAWTNDLLAGLGVYLPAVPQVTTRMITAPTGIPSAMPILMISGIMREEPGGGTVLWVRPHEGGFLWGGMYLTPPRDIFATGPVPRRLDELPLDGVFENLRVARAATFIPQLSHLPGLRVRHGVPCYTPDDVEFVGSVPGLDGLYVVAGDNEHGFSRAPGLGQLLAGRMLNREASGDHSADDPWRVDRFGERFRNESDAFEAVAEYVRMLLS